MLFKRVVVSILFASLLGAAQVRQLTDDEMWEAWRQSANYISARLKVPSTAFIFGIEDTQFARSGKNAVRVRLTVDAQNAYGVMLRNHYTLKVVNLQNGYYRTGLVPARGQAQVNVGVVVKHNIGEAPLSWASRRVEKEWKELRTFSLRQNNRSQALLIYFGSILSTHALSDPPNPRPLC